MKSIFSGAVVAVAIIASLGLNVQAKSFNHASVIAVSDTGKMAKDNMKMDKMKMDKMETKKSNKMAKSKMKADKKMDKMKSGKMKMAKDSSGKM